MKKKTLLIFGILILLISGFFVSKMFNLFSKYEVGEQIDSFNGVAVYYNGEIGNVSGRNVTEDGYNLGLKYQCVEFVKRYYYEELNHKMPESYGHAKDFFDSNLTDGQKNKQRNLTQYKNPSASKPKINDLVIYSGTFSNKYGHVSIISKVNEKEIEVVQQNTGDSRNVFSLIHEGRKWKIDNNRILGWLRK